MMPKIAIGCPVRNRAWILPEYLKALEDIDYPDKVYLFLANDSTDETLDILANFEPKEAVTISNINTGFQHWTRSQYSTNQYQHLADIRNRFLEMFLQTDADYLFSVDSDIIVPPDVLTRLLSEANEQTIVGAAVSNVRNKQLDGTTPGNFWVERDGKMMHPPQYNLYGVMDVAVIGAVYLIPMQAIEDGVRYRQDIHGEDVPFCLACKEKGYKLKVILDLVCDHRMTPPK